VGGHLRGRDSADDAEGSASIGFGRIDDSPARQQVLREVDLDIPQPELAAGWHWPGEHARVAQYPVPSILYGPRRAAVADPIYEFDDSDDRAAR
jgi:hypothetical protein